MDMRRFFMLLALSIMGMSADAQPLRLHPGNPRIFEYQGQPTVLVGSGEHYGAVLNLDFDYTTYLSTLAQAGLNHTRLFTGAHLEVSGAFGIANNSLGPAEGRFIAPWARSDSSGFHRGGNKFDLSKWDPAYFERLADFMEKAARAGVIVEVCLFSSIYGDDLWQNNPFHPNNNVNALPEIPFRTLYTLNAGSALMYQEAYVLKMVKALNGFDNFYFEIQNEPWADNGMRLGQWNEFIQPDLLANEGQMWRTVMEPAAPVSLDWQRHMAKVIREAEAGLPKKHLISQNFGNFWLSVPDLDPQVDILNFHYARPELVPPNWHWNRPIGCNETGFSGRGIDPYRRQAWRFMMSGGSLFSHLDYSFVVGHESGDLTETVAPGAGSPELRAQFRVLKDFLHALPLVSVRPDAQVVAACAGGFTWALSDGRTHWGVYGEALQADMLLLTLPNGTYDFSFQNTVTGEKYPVRTHQVKGKQISLHIPAGEFALHIRRK